MFFRCLECSHHLNKTPANGTSSLITAALNQKLPVDFCMQCFTSIRNPIHLTHHFVSSDTAIQSVEDVVWSVAKHPQTGDQDDNETRNAAREQILSTIRNRELTMDDYEMLLALDATPAQATLATVCITSLPLYNHSESSSQGIGSKLLCWCCDRRSAVHINATTELYANIRVLPCGHLAHDKCLNCELDIFLSNEEVCNTISDYRCSHIDCGAVIFPGLRRHKRRKRTSSESTTTDAAAAAAAAEKSSGEGLAAGTLMQGNSLTFGLVGSALGSTSSNAVSGGANGAPISGTVVRPRRISAERSFSEPNAATISQISTRNNGGLQDMFVGAGSSTVSGDNRMVMRSPSPSSGGLVLGSTSRRNNGSTLDGGGSISGRNTASDISRHAANTDMSAAVILTSRSLSAGGAGSGEAVTVRNRRASSEGIDPLVYRTVNHEYNSPVNYTTAAEGGGAAPTATIRLKRPPRKKPELRTSGNSGPDADLSFAQSLLTVNAIASSQQTVPADAGVASGGYNAFSNEEGSMIGGGAVAAVSPPKPPQIKDPSVSTKNKVSAILSRRIRSNNEGIRSHGEGGSGGEDVPSFDDLAITSAATSLHARQDSNGGLASGPLPRRSPLVILPSTNAGKLRSSGVTGGSNTTASDAAPNVVTESGDGVTRHHRAGSAVEGLTDPDVLSSLLSINSTASLQNSQSAGNLQLQSNGSMSNLNNNRFNEIKTRPPVKGKIVKGFSLSTRIPPVIMTDEIDNEP